MKRLLVVTALVLVLVLAFAGTAMAIGQAPETQPGCDGLCVGLSHRAKQQVDALPEVFDCDPCNALLGQ